MSDSSPGERHPTLYFPNGDVVLSAKLTDPNCSGAPPKAQLFRLHKVLLSHHSSTFANMFADANPDTGESYDGVPLVELQGDKAEDLARLLNYLYNPTQMTFRRFDPDTPLVVSGVIRLADKYCIDPLREHLIRVVASDWPTTLDEWDFFKAEIHAVKTKLETSNRRRAKTHATTTPGEGPGEGYQSISNNVPEPASAIMFAHEFGCHEILRAAYYRLLAVSPRNTWECTWRTSCTEMPCARWELLDAAALLRYMRGVESVLICKPWVFELLGKRCSSRALEIGDGAFRQHPCVVLLQGLIHQVWEHPGRYTSEKDPLGLLLECLERVEEVGERLEGTGELCEECRVGLPGMIAEARRDVWERLNQYFSLDELPE